MSAIVTVDFDPPNELVEKYKEKYRIVAEQLKTLGVDVRDGASELLSNQEICDAMKNKQIEAQKMMINQMKGFQPCEPLSGKTTDGKLTGLDWSITNGMHGSMRDGFYFWYQMRFQKP